VKEAIALATSKLGKSPKYVILFSTVGYDSDELIKEVNRLLPNTKIYGSTSMLGVLTKDGFHVGEIGSLALLAVSSDDIEIGVGGVDLSNFTSAREAGKQAILEAMKDAGKQNEIPKLVLITASPGKEEEIIKGIEDVIGREVPIIGGSSADNDISGKWKQFANNKVYSNGIALAAVYTNLTIGWAYEAGYLITVNKGNVTKAEGRVIYEIDNKPAAEVYNNWTGGVISEELEKGGTVLSKTTSYPLAKIIKGKGGEAYYLSIHPLGVNLPEKSLTVFANVENGDEVMLMYGNWEILLNRAQTTPSHALTNGNISRNEGYFGIYTYCAGTMLTIPEEERYKMPVLIKNVIGDVPFIGTFTFGEQGFLKGVGNVHGNLVNSMIIFAPKK
jgi:hypothetical protein